MYNASVTEYEGDPVPLGQRVDAQKALEAILYIANRVEDPGFHRISKLLYFADRFQLANYGCLIVGDSYTAMKHGPVPSFVYDILKSVRDHRPHRMRRAAATSFDVVFKSKVVPRRDANLALLSKADKESLDFAIAKYGKLSFDELTIASHDAAWRAAAEDDFISIDDIARDLPNSKEVVDYLHASYG
jgi:uncharacterized phage-associated protein